MMAKWTEIKTQVIEEGQEVPLGATKTMAKVVSLPLKTFILAVKPTDEEACEEWKDGN